MLSSDIDLTNMERSHHEGREGREAELYLCFAPKFLPKIRAHLLRKAAWHLQNFEGYGRAEELVKPSIDHAIASLSHEFIYSKRVTYGSMHEAKGVTRGHGESRATKVRAIFQCALVGGKTPAQF
jgi:hypothetical protein